MRKKVLLVLCSILLSLTILWAQSRLVSGSVKDKDGNALPNVSVIIKGTQTGTTTNANGNFSLSVPANAKTLVFSSIGLSPYEADLTKSGVLNAVLGVDNRELDEVVVVAYGSVKKANFIGSAAQVSAKQIENRPITNALSALVGAAPGIQTTTPSGAPGSSPGIIVRGFGSYSLSSGPLYVVDGVIYDGGFSNINPDDIESISVLKDAATTALYGSKGANGVVMITTKKGKKGKQTLQFKVQSGRSNPAIPVYPTVNASQFYPLAWESYRNALHFGSNIPLDSASMIATGTLPRFTAGANTGRQMFRNGNYQDIFQVLGGYNPFNVGNREIVGVDGKINPAGSLLYGDDLNWLDQATRTGTRNEYGINYTAGTERSDLAASFSYLDEGGWGLRSELKRFTGRINANVTPTKWFKSGLNIFANRTKFDYSATGGIVNPFYFARYIAPIYPVYLHAPGTSNIMLDATGNKRFDYGNEEGYGRPYNSGRHSIAEHLWNKDNNVRDAISARGYATIMFTDWLNFTTNISMDITNSASESYENPIVGDGYPAGRYSRDWSKSNSHTFNQLLNFNKKFGDHNVDFLLGHENYNYQSNGTSGMRIGQAFDGIYVFSNFGTINSLSSSITEARSEGYFSRLNYDFQDKYLLTGSIRRDGNSKFPKDLRWSNFWSVGAAWKVDQEKFFNVPWVNALKLGVSYGVTGNSDLGNYPYQAGYSIGYDDDTRAGVYLTALGSKQLTWETQKPLDVTLDFSMFKNKFSGTLAYFFRNSTGLIFGVPQPYQNGGTTGGSFNVQQNIGSMTNKGIEASLTGVLVHNKNFSWSVTLNATHYKNELTKMPAETPALTSSPFKREVGYSIYDFYTRTFYGVDPADGQLLYKGAITYNPVNSRLIDNGKGGFDTVTIDHNNAVQSYIGKTSLPDVYGSVVNNISYKNFNLSFVVTYQLGGSVYDGVYASLMNTATAGATYHTDIMNRWQKAGDITNVPRLDNLRTAQYGAASTRWLVNASYLSINNVSLAYRLPKSFLTKIGSQNARIFLSGENLHFFTHRKGMNVNGSFAGTTSDSYDAARVVNLGFSINF